MTQEKIERVRSWSRPAYTQSKVFRPNNTGEIREALRLGGVLARGKKCLLVTLL